MAKELIALAKHYPGSYYEDYLLRLYKRWNGIECARRFCDWIREAGFSWC